MTQKDVKNEGRTDYVHENTGESDKMYTARLHMIRRKCRFHQITNSATGTVVRPPLMTTMPESVTCHPRARSASIS